MKTKQFEALLDELGALTPIQRAALLTALTSNGTAADVVSLLESEFVKTPTCGHCGSEHFANGALLPA